MCIASTCLALLMLPGTSLAESVRVQLEPKEVQISDAQNVQSAIWRDELSVFKSNLERTKRTIPGVPVATRFTVVTASFRETDTTALVVSVFLNNCEDSSKLSLPESLASCPMRVARIKDNKVTVVKSERQFWFSSAANEYQPSPRVAAKNFTVMSFDATKKTLTSDVFVDGQIYEKPYVIQLSE